MLRTEEVALSQEGLPDLYRLYCYWNSLRSGGELPRKRHLDPLELRDLLDWIFLVEVRRSSDGQPDFIYRLVGEGIMSIHQIRMKGLRPQDLQPTQFGQIIYRHYCEALQREDAIVHSISGWQDSRTPHYCRILLPLSDESGAVCFFLAADHHPPSQRRQSEAYFRNAIQEQEEMPRLLELRGCLEQSHKV
ncbi:PAS domain-containing protein [Fodinicurvata halophila]|uniref:PAS domain-containing protein n=1 Tax=Fodinicurvata halophila TaxID=1419723 RepID=A0ABV8UJC1_9PROT